MQETLTSDALLENTLPNYLIVAGYENIVDANPKPLKTFKVRGSISDASNGIGDSLEYTMRLHLGCEFVKDVATFSSAYRYEQHTPELKWSRENATASESSVDLKVSIMGSTTMGYEYTQESGLEFSAELAKSTFGSKFTTTASVTVEQTEEESLQVKINPNRRLEIWSCPSGVLRKSLTSRYDDHGYTTDATEYVLDDYSLRTKYWTRFLTDGVRKPHAYDQGV